MYNKVKSMMACELPKALIIILIFFILVPTAHGDEWKLKFVERDTRSDSAVYNASIEVFCNNTFQAAYSISDKNHGEEEITLTNCGYGNSIELSFIAQSNDCSLGIHAYDIAVLKDGSNVGFTPWGISKDAACLRSYEYSDTRFILVFPRVSSSGCSYSLGDKIELSTAPLRDAPEIVIKQSDVTFNKSIYEIYDGEFIQINVTAHNTGTENDDNVEISLFLNDVLDDNISGISIDAGSQKSVQFNTTASFASSNKIKVEIKAKPSDSLDEGIEENNNVVKYIVEQRPFFYFTDITDLYSYNNQGEEPYSTWLSNLQSSCTTDLTFDFSSPSAGEASKSQRLVRLALCYQFFGGGNYANKTREGLLFIGDGEWRWANRSYAGNQTDDQDYNFSVSDNPNHASDFPLINYGLAYNWVHEWIEANHESDLGKIRDSIARMCADLYLIAKEVHSYGEGRSIISLNDENLEQLQYLGILGVGAMSILDYDGVHQDLDGSPHEWLEFVRKSLFEESQTGANSPFIDISMENDGLYGNSYMDYYEPEFSIYLYLYKDFMYPNLLDNNMIYWYGLSTPAISLPTGPNANLQTSAYQIWGMVMELKNLYEPNSWERKLLNNYIENVLIDNGEEYEIQANDVIAMNYRGLLCYDKSETSSVQEDTIFSPSGTISVFRSGWERNSTYSYFKVRHDARVTTPSIHQMSFDLFSKGAYLVVDSGDPRWMSSNEKDDAADIGHANWLISEGGDMKVINSISQSQYDYSVPNPSYIDFALNGTEIDLLEASMDATEWKTVRSTETGTFTNSVDITRTMLFPSSEYFIVADRLESDGSHDYSMLIPLGSTEGHSGVAGYTDNYIFGNITVNGAKEDWWDCNSNTAIGGDYAIVENITWMTLSETNAEVTVSNEVNLTIHLNPKSDITINITGMHIGNNEESYDFYHPYIKVHQSGQSVKYLTTYYPTDIDDTTPTITGLIVTGGGGGDDYATKIIRGSVTDTISISDGEIITADVMTTDALLAFSRSDAGVLEYFFIRNGTTFSYSGNDMMSVSTAPDYVLVSYNGDDITIKVDGSGSNTITLKNLNPSKVYAVKMDGAAYSNWQMQNSDKDIAITASLSEHTFEIYVTGDREDGEDNGNGGSPSTGSLYTPPACEESWECTTWSACELGLKSRNCSDINNCGTIEDKPAEETACCSMLEILMFPIEVRINNGTKTSFIVSIETDCDPETVELNLDGIDKEWYTVEKLMTSTPGIVEFNVSLDVPADTDNETLYIVYQPVSALISGPEYNSILEIVTPKTDKIQASGEAPQGEETWIFLQAVLAVILAVSILFLFRIYRSM